MLIFWESGLVLLAVPKTGTQSIEAALAPQADIVFRNPPKLKHMRLTWVEKSIPRLIGREEWPRFRTIAVIREPLDWLGSWYRYRRRDALVGRPVSTQNISFEEFLEAHISKRPPEYANVGSQARFVQNREGETGVDYLFPYDRMDELVAFLSDTLDKPIKLERRNVSPKAPLDVSDDLRARVRIKLLADFELYRKISQTDVET